MKVNWAKISRLLLTLGYSSFAGVFLGSVPTLLLNGSLNLIVTVAGVTVGAGLISLGKGIEHEIEFNNLKPWRLQED